MHVINATASPSQQHAQHPPPNSGMSGGNSRMAGSVPHYNAPGPAQNGASDRSASFSHQLRASPQAAQPSGESESDSDSSFGLDSVIDAINPLHHLPVAGTIYREITGDELGPVARVAGGALYGGAAGAALGAGNVALKQISGDDLAGHAMAMLNNGGTASQASSPTHDTSPEARVANAIAAYGTPAGESQPAGNSHTDTRSRNAQPAHIRQSSYNG